jgi:hypothetical protein
MENIYLTLPSNTTDFSTNATSEFRVQLPNELQLDGEWEMALVEMQYPYSWNNLKGGAQPDSQDNWILITMNGDKKKLIDGRMVEINVPPGHYRDVHELIEAMNEALRVWKAPGSKTHPLPKLVKVTYDELHKRVKLKLNTTAIKGVILGTVLQYMLGFGGEWSRAFTKPVYKAKYPPDITGGFTTLFVYCNLVQPQVVGNILAPLLRTVPVEGEYGATVDKVFLDPHYLPLRCKSFDSVHIAIKDDTDTPVKFNFGKTIIKVHLRRKQ